MGSTFARTVMAAPPPLASSCTSRAGACEKRDRPAPMFCACRRQHFGFLFDQRPDAARGVDRRIGLCPLAPDTRERFSDVRFDAAGVLECLRVEDAMRRRGAHKRFVHVVASRAIGNLWMFELEPNTPVRMSRHRNVCVPCNFREAWRAFAAGLERNRSPAPGGLARRNSCATAFARRLPRVLHQSRSGLTPAVNAATRW